MFKGRGLAPLHGPCVLFALTLPGLVTPGKVVETKKQKNKTFSKGRPSLGAGLGTRQKTSRYWHLCSSLELTLTRIADVNILICFKVCVF